MKKYAAVLMLLIMSVLTAFPSSSAEARVRSNNEAETVQAEELSINMSRVTVKPGKKVYLKVTGNVGKVEWVSKNPEVAIVSSKGRVTAVSEGKTDIVAKFDGIKLRCKVKVEAVKTVSIIAVGDNMYHQNTLNSYIGKNGEYYFDNIYTNIAEYIKDRDVKIINQEVILTPDSSLWAGYPSFAAPLEAGDAVVRAGFNVITCATNHTFDKRVPGIMSAVKYWRSREKDGVTMVGMYDNQADFDKICVKEYNGIKIAFLNYTQMLNGLSLPSDKQYLVKLMRESAMKSDIERARKKADFVIVLPHWGEEYMHQPCDYQVKMGQKLADWGADLIIGTHPHVVEPLRMITSADGRTVPCYYSLGNFCANMWRKDCDLEAMAEIKIKKWDGKVTVADCKMTPLVNHIIPSEKEIKIYRLDEYTDALGSKHIISYRSGNPKAVTVKSLWDLFNSIK